MNFVYIPNFIKFLLKLTLIGGLVLALMISYVAFMAPAVPNDAPQASAQNVVRVKINPKSNVTNVANQMAAQGLEVSVWRVQLVARSFFLAKNLKAGVYDFPKGASLASVLAQMARGDSVKLGVTLVEGWTFAQFKAAIDAQPELKKETKGLSSKQLLAKLDAKEAHPEGLFFPDTYIYEPGDSDLLIYQKAYRAMQVHLNDAWGKRHEGSPIKSPYELLKLASIIEKETGHPDDRGLVSAVFNNRLKIGMKLQTDPTIIYGLGSTFDGDLRKKDLLKDGPYNSYTRYGLPPTPIAIPGKNSLLAAAQP
ncbi:MAG: endolytic transglycosylase MltG, partial [Pseudomonadota bacterium]